MMNETIKDFKQTLDEALQSMDFEKSPRELYEPLRYMMHLGGKRIRPILTLLGYLCCRQDWPSIVKPALSVELFHNFTLLHDDIMDEAPLRRGQATVHQKWNKNIAILAGDLLMIKAYELLAEAPARDLKYLLQRFNACATQVCEGQQLDMNFETRAAVSEAEYMHMIRLKTAVLPGYSLELGGLLGGMNQEQAAHLRAFGEQIGMGFQMKDDLLDVYGNAQKVGKQIGGDILSNKKTLLLVKALNAAQGEQHAELNRLLHDKSLAPQHKIAQVKALYEALRVRQQAEQQMNEHFKLGFEHLQALDDAAFNLKPLSHFVQGLISRES